MDTDKGGSLPTPSPLSGPVRSNPPGRGVGGLPVNPPPLPGFFAGYSFSGTLANPFASSGTFCEEMPGKGVPLKVGGRGLPANPPSHKQGGRPGPPSAGRELRHFRGVWRVYLSQFYVRRVRRRGGLGLALRGGGLAGDPPGSYSKNDQTLWYFPGQHRLIRFPAGYQTN
jgi:hypothetical protein